MKRVLRFASFFALTLCVVGSLMLLQEEKTEEKTKAAIKLNGLYRAFPAVPQFGASVGDTYLFAANGDVYKGWTGTQSVEKFNFARAKTKQPANTGKYAVAGDKITFRWNNGQSESAHFSVRRDAKSGRTTIAIGPYFCYKIVTWGKVLSGTFVPSTYQGGYDSPQKSPRIVDKISFTRAGQFSITDDNNQVTQKGRYTVSGAALTLVSANGQRSTHSLHVFDDHKPTPTAVFLNGRPFFSEKK